MLTPDQFRQLLLDDVKGIRANLDQIWKIAQSQPPGDARTSLEIVHQSLAQQQSLSLKKTLMEMV